MNKSEGKLTVNQLKRTHTTAFTSGNDKFKLEAQNHENKSMTTSQKKKMIKMHNQNRIKADKEVGRDTNSIMQQGMRKN